MTRHTILLASLALALLTGDLFAQRRLDRRPDRRHDHVQNLDRREQVIYDTYVAFMDRAPSRREMARWRDWSRGRSLFDLEAQILGSEEIFASYGTNIHRFTRALYQHYLGHQPTEQDLYYWQDYFFYECGQRRSDFTRGFLSWVREKR